MTTGYISGLPLYLLLLPQQQQHQQQKLKLQFQVRLRRQRRRCSFKCNSTSLSLSHSLSLSLSPLSLRFAVVEPKVSKSKVYLSVRDFTIFAHPLYLASSLSADRAVRSDADAERQQVGRKSATDNGKWHAMPATPAATIRREREPFHTRTPHSLSCRSLTSK
ncbi:uncharacterized protein LOC111080294 isoform X2 [Drosophila obscura]|uniref:uncharacterized protein LOC111080294 isoform X2 n=1 Tax=Drosophila obscura TaxID=7282 RepID=UPI001BB1864E|nr:uncharacterized protein LOC111080294 isoform X2 [Drosophila obscura]